MQIGSGIMLWFCLFGLCLVVCFFFGQFLDGIRTPWFGPIPSESNVRLNQTVATLPLYTCSFVQSRADSRDRAQTSVISHKFV